MPDTDKVEVYGYLRYSFYGYSVELAEKEILRRNTEWFLDHIHFKKSIQESTFRMYNNLNDYGKFKLHEALETTIDNDDEELPFD